MANSAVIKALHDFVKISYPNIGLDDSGMANPAGFPTNVISSLTFDDDGRGTDTLSFTVDYWHTSTGISIDALQTLMDGVKAVIDGKVISFTGGIYLPHFDTELPNPQEPDYIHKVQKFSGSIIYGG